LYVRHAIPPRHTMPFVEMQAGTGATARLLQNRDALADVFSFLAVDTVACFACADFFSAWYHITGTSSALAAHDRLQAMFELWCDEGISWFVQYNDEVAGCWQAYEEAATSVIFERFLRSHALAAAFNGMFHFGGLRRRKGAFANYHESDAICNHTFHRSKRDKLNRKKVREEEYVFAEDRLKKHIPQVLHDWRRFYAPLEEYAHLPRAHFLSHLVFTYVQIGALSPPGDCCDPEFGNDPYLGSAALHELGDAQDENEYFREIKEIRGDLRHLKNAILLGLLLTPELFMYICRIHAGDNYVSYGVEYFETRKYLYPFVDAMARRVRAFNTCTKWCLTCILEYYAQHHEYYFGLEDQPKITAFMLEVLPFLDDCIEDPRLAKRAMIRATKFRIECAKLGVWQQVKSGAVLKNVLDICAIPWKVSTKGKHN